MIALRIAFMATAILKDKASRFDVILFSAPIGKYSYLSGRFLGAFGALLLVMAAARRDAGIEGRAESLLYFQS